MSPKFDSFNCVDVDIDASRIPSGPTTPVSPKLRELIRREQELLREAGLLPPLPDSAPPGKPPAAK
jgi:hypothetical protein